MQNRKLNILALPLFGRKGASSRYRLYQYLPLLEKKGITCRTYPLINDNAYDILLGINKVSPLIKSFYKFYYVISALIKRFFLIFSAYRYDIVFIQKDVLPSFYLYMLKKMNPRIIFDLDDALYENHSTLKPSVFSLDNIFLKFRKNNLDKMLKCAQAVTVTTPYLAEYVRKFNSNVHVITGPIDIDIYNILLKEKKSRTVIGWIGSPVTTKYVQDILPALRDIVNDYPDIQFSMIGAKEFDTGDLNIKFFKWSEETEIALLSDFDIGIMPLTDDKWSKGKGGLKLLQYFAMGIPVVCSPVGINKDIVKDGENGFFASDGIEWKNKIGKLISSETLRSEMGKSGRKLVEQKFDLKKSADYMESLIRGLL